MRGVSSVRLRNFRRYEDVTFTFESGTTFLEGENNAGKTSVFYAIEYALFGRVGTVLGPSDLMRPKADGVGVELCFVGRDGRTYRLQRVHVRPPGSRTKVVGHFTLWVRDAEEDAAERYLLSSDFDDLETDLALAVQQALGMTRRGWDLAMHLRQGHIPDILDGSPQLDIVLGVTSAVFVEEELRAMALEREKAAGELPALEATLERLQVERASRAERLAALQAERVELEAKQADATGRAAALRVELGSLGPLREAAEALARAEQRVAEATTEVGRAVASRDALGSLDALQATVGAAGEAVAALEGRRQGLRDALSARRDGTGSLEQRRGDLRGRLERRRAMDGVSVCDHCGQAVDAAHLAAQIPEIEAALAALEAELTSLAEATAADEAALATVDDELSETRVGLRSAEEAVRRNEVAAAGVAEAQNEQAEAASALSAARQAARAHAEADDDGLLAALRERFEAERDRLRAAQVRLEADLEHGAERIEQLASDVDDVTDTLRGLEREHAQTEAKCGSLRADTELAGKLRVLGKAFKQVQQDLREQATAAMAERTLAIHRHLSGDDKELKDVVVDPKRYVVHVTPRDIGKRVPAGHAQGGGHRLLLGLAARLALAEQLGPVPFILLDEPTYGLDVRRREALLGRISELEVAGQLLLITHHDVGTERGRVVRIVRDGASSRVEAG